MLIFFSTIFSDVLGEGIELQQISAKVPPIEENRTRDLSIDDVMPRDMASKERVKPSEFPTKTEFRPRDVPDTETAQPRDARHDKPTAMNHARPPSFSGDLDVSGTSLIISPAAVPDEPCTFTECQTVEDGSHPIEFGKKLDCL